MEVRAGSGEGGIIYTKATVEGCAFAEPSSKIVDLVKIFRVTEVDLVWCDTCYWA
jgi:hypothetical protein